MADRKRTVSSCSVGSEYYDHFYDINERPVDDISLEFFYKPHTITLLTLSILGLIYYSFARSEESTESNIWSGLCMVIFFFLIISVLAFPNGPFTRPHPAIWRMVFGVSVLYFMLLLFIVPQTYKDVKEMMYWVYPDLRHWNTPEKEYAINCSDISIERVWSHMDVFAFGHFFGWAVKALLLRHYGICWTLSLTWEATEMAFAHLLPNFAECWWDQFVLDFLLCNGLGIFFGMWVARCMEMRDYHWESIRDIRTTTGKLRRAVLQFTPVSWMHVRWLDPNSTRMRVVAICIMVIVWQFSELNTFFLKHIFVVDTGHPLSIFRLMLISLIGAPSIRQYYSYVTDTQCTRMGTQCWMFCAVTFTEAIICVKFGLELFKRTEIINILYWLGFQFLISIVCIYACAVLVKRGKRRIAKQVKKKTKKTFSNKNQKKKKKLGERVTLDDTKKENGFLPGYSDDSHHHQITFKHPEFEHLPSNGNGVNASPAATTSDATSTNAQSNGKTRNRKKQRQSNGQL